MIAVPCSQSEKSPGGDSRARKELGDAAAAWKAEADELSTFRNIAWEEGQAGAGSVLPGQVMKTGTKDGNSPGSNWDTLKASLTLMDMGTQCSPNAVSINLQEELPCVCRKDNLPQDSRAGSCSAAYSGICLNRNDVPEC